MEVTVNYRVVQNKRTPGSSIPPVKRHGNSFDGCYVCLSVYMFVIR